MASKKVKNFEFTKTWRDDNAFPTYEDDEAQVREDLQCLHDEVKDYINKLLLPKLNGLVLEDITNPESGKTLSEILDGIAEDISEIGSGSVEDGGITEAKIHDGAVTEDKIEDGAVTEDKIEDGAVTEDKIDSDAVTVTKVAPGGLFLDTSSSASYELVVGTGRVSPTGGSVEYVRVCPGLKMVFFGLTQPVQISANTYEIVHFDLQGFPSLTDATMMDVCVTVEIPEGELGAGLPASGFDGWHVLSRGAKVIWVEKKDANGSPGVATWSYGGVFKVTGSYVYE